MPLDDRTRELALAAAVEAARRASEYLRAALGHARSIRHKGGNVMDLVTEHDLTSEEMIRRHLRGAFPSWGLFCEEGGAEGPTDPRWIVDPLDGTTNFAHGLPIFAVAIALEHEGEIDLAVVDAPMLGAVWTARAGRGATRDGRPLHVSRTDRLDESLLATGFPYDLKISPDNNFAEFARVQLRAQAVRRCGSAVLDLAWLAEGSFDGYWEKKLKPWDWATGVLLISEAGGRVSGGNGGPSSIYGETLVASNGLIHEELLSALASA
ncbi:MAG: inositol monophosphatase [Deltaproteobacteria bacterium]|nr:inositol monophosphatase [Deltaproteobacteria bacterium]